FPDWFYLCCIMLHNLDVDVSSILWFAKEPPNKYHENMQLYEMLTFFHLSFLGSYANTLVSTQITSNH
ncbi:hypothetical protein L9F63_019038, partial [Diploptera punctata]